MKQMAGAGASLTISEPFTDGHLTTKRQAAGIVR